ncbi:MAG: hypothetical protein E7265_06685 [Lachnospiraceae bacterium]|nr:hypothetical protein [Lachnospiraceae bacterium]
MFIKLATFKKLVKTAYTHNRLVVCHVGEDYIISGGGWRIQVDSAHLPNQYKAVMVEHIGDMPAAGEGFEYGPDMYQQIIAETVNVVPEYDECTGEVYRPTNIMINARGNTYVVMQGDNNTYLYVNRVLCDMVDNKCINEAAGEYVPDFPKKINIKSDRLVWGNNVMLLEVITYCPIITFERWFIERMTGFDVLSMNNDILA